MHKITTLDDHWLGRPRSIGTALLESDGHRAIVDPGPGSTIDTLRKELSARGVSVNDLEAILLTHIHLDHAGSTGALVKENPRVAVYVHALGAPHLIDPSKLLASAARLWPDNLRELFGEALPVAESNLRVLEGGETITLGSRKIAVAYTPGHASHHVSYFENVEGVAFVGDTTGVSIEGLSYVMPATPPPDIDLRLWDSSLATILERKPQRLFLTHFGFSENPAAHVEQFRERLHRWMETTEKILQTAKNDAGPMASFVAAMRAEIGEHLPAEEVEHYVATAGLNLSFLGLARHAHKRAQAASSSAKTISSS
jgi:glyoxylase-like metal-dependent hydrolase (beta-lactamase superfamily II)